MTKYQAELYHHGIKGQKWGVRRFQNPDGTLTAKGMKRYEQGRLKLKSGYSVDAKGKVGYETDSKGNLTKAGAKAWYYNDTEVGDMIGDELDAQNEYDKTSEGKRLLAEYQKQIEKLETDDNWDNDKKAQEQFNKAEETYLRKQKEYAAKKLVKKYGQSKANLYANRGVINAGKDAVSALSDEWWVHAY